MISRKHSKFLITYIKRSSLKSFLIIFFLITISIFLEAAFIKSLQNIIFDIQNLAFNKIINGSLTALALVISCSVFKILQTKFYVRYSAYLGKLICEDCIKGYFGENIFKTKSRDSSDLINSIIIQSNHITKGVIFASLNLITYSLICISIFYILFSSLGIPIIIIIIFSLLLYILIAKKSKKLLENLSFNQVNYINRITNQILYLINNKRRVFLNRHNKNIFKKVFELNSEYRNFISKQVEVQALPKFYVETFAISSLLVVLISFSYNGDTLIIAKTGSIFFGILRLLPNFQFIFFAWSSIKSSSSQIDAFLTYKNNFEFQNVPINSQNSIHSIELKINSKKTITLSKGDSLCIYGKSGCGKTTFLDKVSKLNDSLKDEIIFLNSSGEKIEDKSIKSQIAYVEQDVYLEDKTINELIFENNLNKINYNLETIVNLADLNELIYSDFWKKKKIGTNGGNLSGGQKQRVAIADSIAWKPSLLILDEATAGIDKISENKIWNNLIEKRDFIIIAVTHNTKLFEKFDYLLDLSKNKNLKE